MKGWGASLVATLALVFLALLGLWWIMDRLVFVRVERDVVRAPEAVAPAPPSAEPAVLASEPRARTEVASAAADAPALDAPAAEDAAPVTVRVHGRVLDPTGQGLAGVALVQSGGMFNSSPGHGTGAEVAVSGPGGRFEAELTLGRARVQLEVGRDSGFATLRAGSVTRDAVRGEVLVVAAPVIELAGTVAEAGGAPLDGARVGFEVPLTAFVGFPEPLDATIAVKFESVSGNGGRFSLARVPAVNGAELAVRHTGHRSAAVAAPAVRTDDLWIELERQERDDPWLTGVVLRADGTPAKGARVQLDELSTKAGSDGSFAFEKEWANDDAPLVAALTGFQPAILPDMGAVMQEELPPVPVRLVLGGPALTIRGRVLDADGDPCRDWNVGLFDGTQVTRNRVPVDLAEDLVRGKHVETETDRKGAFELEGLLPRSYVVQAYDPDTLLMLRSDAVAAGTMDLVLRVPPDAMLERVAGVVVGRDGTPIEDAEVEVRLVTASSGGGISYESGDAETTDARGRFELEDVPRRHVSLDVVGEQVIPQNFELDLAHTDAVRLVVARRCHFRIELAGSAAAASGPDSFSALDADGQALNVHNFQGRGWSASSRTQLSKEGTHPLAVSEDARTLVFYREGAEVGRVSIGLVPGETAVVRYE